MKKLSLYVFVIVILLLSLTGCSNKKMTEDKNTYFYLGQSNSWLVIYSITKVESTYYDSLSIQYIFDDNSPSEKTQKIGPIEYQLNGNSMKAESSYPQELQGVGNFHTGSIMNADAIKITFDKEMDLSIQWQDNKESITLKRQD
ncbi:MAG TPA: hypothetical protein GXX75_05655 [Clostridiales bacterium]|nr:hypothetical protein [Clostridiales bacterium]